MPPLGSCRADWLRGIAAQLTAAMDGAPAPAPPGCQLAQKSHIYVWNSTILCASTEHTLLHTSYSTKRLQPPAKLVLISKSVPICFCNPGSQVIAHLGVHDRGRFWHSGWILWEMRCLFQLQQFFCVSFRYCPGWLWKGDGIYFLHHKAPIVQDIQETWKNEGPPERKYQEEKDLKYAILHILRSSKANSVWFVHQFLPSHGCPEYYRFYPVTITSNYVFQEQKDI